MIDGIFKKEAVTDQSTVSKKMEKSSNINREAHRRNRKLAYSAVGTPDYVAPEVQGKIGYT